VRPEFQPEHLDRTACGLAKSAYSLLACSALRACESLAINNMASEVLNPDGALHAAPPTDRASSAASSAGVSSPQIRSPLGVTIRVP
jgi:hypothetical protein